MKYNMSLKLVVVLLLLPSLQVLSQNGTKLIGYDAVTAGRGGTATGTFDNPSLMMNNPAGIAFLKSSQMDVGISLMAPSVFYKNGINDTKGKNNLFPLGCLSYVKKSDNKFTFGAGLFTQGGMGADFKLNHDLYKDATGAYVQQDYHSKFAVMQGGLSVAYKITPVLSVGVTANLLYSMMELQMPMSMSPSRLKGVINPTTGMTFGDMFSAPPASGGLGYSEVVANANMSGLTAYEFNGKIGFAYKPSDKFSVGINYTLPTTLHYKNGSAQMDMTYQMNDAFGKVVGGIMAQNPSYTPAQAQAAAMTQFGSMGIDLSKGAKDTYTSNATLGLPQSLAIGASLAASKKLRLSMDAEWVNWSNAFNTMNISLAGGTNANINRMLGTNGTIEMPFPLNWKDALLIRAGAEYIVSDIFTIRAGYAYGTNPVPETTVFPVFPAIIVHHVTVGGTVGLSKTIKLNAAYEHSFRNDETAVANSYVGAQFNNSTSGLSNEIFHISLSWIIGK